MIQTNINYTSLQQDDLIKYQSKVREIHKMIHEKSGLGSEYLGWVTLPENDNTKQLQQIKLLANALRQEVEILLVIGIGGSYLGAKAAIEMINGLYAKTAVEVIYVGNTMSSTYTSQVLEKVKDKEFAINVISKSGSTIEPAIAFRLFKDLLEKVKGKEIAKSRIIVTTDKEKGILKTLAMQEGYNTLVIPNDIGGRFSVLTPVGLFAMAMCEIDIDEVIQGSKLAYQDLLDDTLNNQAYKYAVTRTILHEEKKYPVEMLVSYEMQMQSFMEWWKQLFGESEGKNHKGLLPTSVIFSTDLHSLGQFIQQGSKVLFETVLQIKHPTKDVNIPHFDDDLDKLNYLTSRSLNEVNNLAYEGTLIAHSKVGRVPNIVLELASMDAKMFGYLTYFFFKACAMSAYLLAVNPFDQPGVEIYKQEMFTLLEK